MLLHEMCEPRFTSTHEQPRICARIGRYARCSSVGMLRASVESAVVVIGWIACVAATGWVSAHAADSTTQGAVSAASLAAAALVTHHDPAAPAEPAPPPPDATTLIETALERARGLGAMPMREVRAAAIVDELVDVDAFTRRSFGVPCPTTKPCRDRWRTLTLQQRTEMVTLTKALLAQRILKHGSQLSQHAVTIVGVREAGDTVRVRTEMTRAGEPTPLRMDFVLANAEGRHRIVDVVTEGSSMAKNHYDQYERMLDDPARGYPHLVARVQNKAAGR